MPDAVLEPLPIGTELFLRTATDGRLWLIATRSETRVRSEWEAAISGSWRDVEFRHGTATHDGEMDASEQTVATAMRARWVPDAIDSDHRRTRAASGRLLAALAEATTPDETAIIDRFHAACGRTTLMAAHEGMPASTLLCLDERCGAEAVEETFARWPLLLHQFLWLTVTPGALPLVRKVVEARNSADDAAAALAEIAFDPSDQPNGPMDAATYAAASQPRNGEPGPEARLAGLRMLLRRMQGVDAYCRFLRDVATLAASVPPDWIPSDPEEFVAFESVARKISTLALHSRGALDVGVLAASSKGRWKEFRRRMATIGHVRDVDDMVQAFVRQAVKPAIAHTLVFELPDAGYDTRLRDAVGMAVDFGHPPMVRGIFHEAPGSPRLVEKQAFDEKIGELGWKLLFAAKSAPAVLEASKAWHAVQGRWESSIGTDDGRTWAVPFGSIAVSPGVDLVAIADSAGLKEEGASLRHCVGGYGDRCASRASVVAAVRRSNPDGTTVSTSTVEFGRWEPGKAWRPVVVQHRGAANSKPSGDDLDAVAHAVRIWLAEGGTALGAPEKVWTEPTLLRNPLAWWRRLKEAHDADPDGDGAFFGGLQEPDPFRRDAARIPDQVSESAGYDWMAEGRVANALAHWSRFLPRDAAAAGAAGIVARADAMFGPDFLALLRAKAAEAAEAVSTAVTTAVTTTAPKGAWAYRHALMRRFAATAVGRIFRQMPAMSAMAIAASAFMAVFGHATVGPLIRGEAGPFSWQAAFVAGWALIVGFAAALATRRAGARRMRFVIEVEFADMADGRHGAEDPRDRAGALR